MELIIILAVFIIAAITILLTKNRILIEASSIFSSCA